MTEPEEKPRKKYNKKLADCEGYNPAFKKAWQERYIDFMADPLERRSALAFTRDEDIDESTLYVWRKKHYPDIMKAIEKRRVTFTTQIRSEAWKSVMRSLGGDDTAAQKLAFTLLGDFVERTETTTNFHNRDEKQEIIKKRLAELMKNKTVNKKITKKLEGE